MSILDKFWYHKIDLGEMVTPGQHPFSPDAYKIPDRLDGKRVLDVGAWDGFWTFEALKRGAKEVVAIDDWSDMEWLEKENRIEWDTFDYCKGKLGYTDEQCKRHTKSLYHARELGKFDVIFFFGTLYHCRYPLLALDRMAEMCTGQIYIETAICNDYSPYREHIGAGYNNDRDIVMEFYPGKELGGVGSNWWAPTTNCLQFMVESAGFNVHEVWKYKNPTCVATCRGFLRGTKK